MYEAAIKQEFRCHCRKSEERKRNAYAKPRKIPARPGRNKKCAGQKLEDISPVDFHDSSLASAADFHVGLCECLKRVESRRPGGDDWTPPAWESKAFAAPFGQQCLGLREIAARIFDV
jgi:hypothetical protein